MLTSKLLYINRKKDKYYLKAVSSKTGKIRYYVVKNLSKIDCNDLLEELPAGFEFYEHPHNAQVVLRKIPIYNITDAEVEIVNSVMEKHETVSDYIVEKCVDHIVVYCGRCNIDDFSDFPQIRDQFHLIQSYEDILRFEKAGKTYRVQRFCCLSRHYGWIIMEKNKDLRYLAEKYCYHIDKESLLNFWIDGEVDY